MHSQSNKERALRLRLKGHSYNEIERELTIPKSTLRAWLRDTVLSDMAHARLMARMKSGSLVLIKRNKMQTHFARQRAHQIRTLAANRVHELGKKDLLLVGAVLYWAEGYKRIKVRHGREITSHAISFVNSDADMIRTFTRFLIEILHIERSNIRLIMRLYPHINEREAKRYWMDVTGLRETNFWKSTSLITGASKGIRPFNRLPHGTLQISVNSTPKFYELIGLLDGVKGQTV